MAEREHLICILMGVYLAKHPIAPFKDVRIFIDQQLQKLNLEQLVDSDANLFDSILNDCWYALQASGGKSLFEAIHGKPRTLVRINGNLIRID